MLVLHQVWTHTRRFPAYSTIFSWVRSFKKEFQETTMPSELEFLKRYPLDPSSLPTAVRTAAYDPDDEPVTQELANYQKLSDHIPLRSNSALLVREQHQQLGAGPSAGTVTWNDLRGVLEQMRGPNADLPGFQILSDAQRSGRVRMVDNASPLQLRDARSAAPAALPASRPLADSPLAMRTLSSNADDTGSDVFPHDSASQSPAFGGAMALAMPAASSMATQQQGFGLQQQLPSGASSNSTPAWAMQFKLPDSRLGAEPDLSPLADAAAAVPDSSQATAAASTATLQASAAAKPNAAAFEDAAFEALVQKSANRARKRPASDMASPDEPVLRRPAAAASHRDDEGDVDEPSVMRRPAATSPDDPAPRSIAQMKAFSFTLTREHMQGTIFKNVASNVYHRARLVATRSGLTHAEAKLFAQTWHQKVHDQWLKLGGKF